MGWWGGVVVRLGARRVEEEGVEEVVVSVIEASEYVEEVDSECDEGQEHFEEEADDGERINVKVEDDIVDEDKWIKKELPKNPTRQ